MRWLSGQGPRGPGPGWVKAPTGIELEIRAVWQEDEMPVEVTGAPGYRPFTLGPDSQDWVDSMVEVVDANNAVFGRPKPVVPKTHRSLASAPPEIPSPSPLVVFTVPAARVQPQPAPPRIVMPDIPGQPAAPARTLPPRIVMPDIGTNQPIAPPTHQSAPEIGREPATATRVHPSMPDIAGESGHQSSERPTMPNIGQATTPSSRHAGMPDIGNESTHPSPERDLMPEIEEEPAPRRHSPPMPEIGEP